MKQILLRLAGKVARWLIDGIPEQIITNSYTYKLLEHEAALSKSSLDQALNLIRVLKNRHKMFDDVVDQIEGLEIQVNDLLETNKNLYKQLSRSRNKS